MKEMMNLLEIILVLNGFFEGGRAFSSTRLQWRQYGTLSLHHQAKKPTGRNRLRNTHHFAWNEDEITALPKFNSNSTDPYSAERTNENEPSTSSLIPSFIKNWVNEFQLAQEEGFGTKAKNIASTMSIDDVVVPICGNLSKRQELANRGIYAGVEYKVCNLTVSVKDDETQPISTLQGLSPSQMTSTVAWLKPNYPLRDYLERSDWPVPVQPVVDVPLFLSKTTYTAGTLVGTLGLATTYLTLAAIVASVVRLAYVPSESMLPALQPRSLVLVVRSIPFVDILRPKVGSVVLFDPPEELSMAIPNSQVWDDMGIQKGPTSPLQGQQLLKRVVAIPGEVVGVKNASPYVLLGTKQGEEADANDSTMRNTFSKQKFRVDVTGAYAKPELFSESSWNRPADKTMPLTQNEYFVAGDNGYRSVDSRVWGPLKKKYIFGTAKWILLPFSDFGPLPEGQIYEVEK